MPEKLALAFEKMDFFELQEDDNTIVYCYEQESYPYYLIASNELGETPTESQDIIIACYDSSSDVFLWKLEFSSINELQDLYNQDNSKFLQLLEKKAL